MPPAVVRTPSWPAIDCSNGNKIYPTSSTVVSPTSFYMDYPSVFLSSVGFIEAPYQDTQVQNFQGGFVLPGEKWFRAPL